MATCKMVYFDEFGNVSAMYESMVAKHGPVKGEEMYIKHMMGMNTAQFSKSVPVISESLKALDQLQKDLRDPKPNDKQKKPSDNMYNLGGKLYNRTTKWLSSFPAKIRNEWNIIEEVENKGFDKEKISLEEAYRELKRDARAVHGQEYFTEKQLDEAVAKRIKDEPGILEGTQQSIKNQWDAKAEYGTYIHALMENAVIIRNERYAENEAETDPSKKRDVDKEIHSISEEAHRRTRATYTTDNMPEMWDKSGIANTLREVLELADTLEKRYGKKFVIRTEIKLKSETLGDPVSPGLAGSADLLFISEDGKDVYIGDFKTKDSGSLENFDRIVRGTIGGPFGNMPNNAAGKAEAQMSTYGAMLEDMGFNVLGGSVVILKGAFAKKEYHNNLPIGERQYKYVKLLQTEIVDVDLRVSDVVLHSRGEDIAAEKLKSQDEGAYGMVRAFSEDKIAYIRDNPEAFIRLYNGKIITKGGHRYIPNEYTNTPIRILSTDTQEDIDKKILSIRDDAMERQAKVADNIMRYFSRRHSADGKKKSEFGSTKTHVDMLLSGLSIDTHALHIAENFHPAFRGMGPDVLVAVNRSTGDITMLSATSATNRPITFDDDGKNRRTSMFGKYLTDTQLIAQGVAPALVGSASNHAFINQKLAIGALQYIAATGGKVGVSGIKTASIVGNKLGTVTASNMPTELAVLKKFANIPDAAKDIPDSVMDIIIGGNGLMDARTYKEDFLTQLSDLLAGPDNVLSNDKSQTRALQTALTTYSENPNSINNLIKLVGQYRRSYAFRLNQDWKSDKQFLILNSTLLSLLDIDQASMQVRQETLSGSTFTKTAITSGDYYAMKLQTLYNSAAQRIQKDMSKVQKDNTKKFHALLKDAGVSQNAGTEGLKKAFEPLYRDFDMTDKSNNSNWMKLKDPEDMGNGLNDVQRDYIRFFNKTVVDAMVRSSNTKDATNIKNGMNWAPGSIPIYSETSDILDKKSYKSGRAFLRSITAEAKTKAEEDTSKGFDFVYDSGISSQFGDADNHNSDVRRRMLGIGSDSNSDGEPNPNIEKNLAVIVMHTALQGSMQENMQILADTYSAMDTLLLARRVGEKLDTHASQELLRMTSEMVIHDRYKQESEVADHIDKIKKYVSQFMFTLSTKQGMLEAMTQSVNSSTSLIANVINKAAFKDGRFGYKDFEWAVKSLLNGFDREHSLKVNQMIEDHNMLMGDPKSFKSNEYTKIKKWHLWESKALRGMNTMPFNYGIKKIVLAQMRAKGIDQAYVNKGTKEDPDWVYDETKDPRFFVYDSSKPNSKTNVPPKTLEERKRNASWKLAKDKMLKEDMLDEDGNMTRALFSEQRSDMKQYATKLFGTFGKDGVTMSNYTAVGRVLMTYKGWFAQKIANYHTVSHMSEIAGHEVYNEDTGEMMWEGQEIEGIIQSVNKLFKEIQYYKLLQLQNVELTHIQKENLSKLLADMMMLIFVNLAVWPLLEIDNDFMKSDLGKSFKKSALNATGELNVAATASSMMSNIAPVLSIMESTGMKVVTGTYAMMTGDVKGGAKIIAKGASKGGIQTMSDITDQLTD